MKVVVNSTKSSIDEVIQRLSTYSIKTNSIVMTSSRKDREGNVTFYYQLDININIHSIGYEKLELVMKEIKEVEKIF